MTSAAAFEEINEAKANMDDIYDQADPRAYFGELKKLAYGIPNVAKPIFLVLSSHLRQRLHHTIHILDVGCSYGVNAALLKHDMSMRDLYEHWGQEKLADATPEEVVEYDRRFFSNLGEPEDIEIIGIDQAENAIAFSEEVGLLNKGFSINLETEPLPVSAEEELASIDLMISTGCIGYVTERTFERLLPAIARDRQPWIANFVVRMFPFDAIEETLSDWGYMTEKLESRTLVQRNFASPEEQEQILEQLRKKGIDPTGRETEGCLLAEFYLSRPVKDVAEAPMEQLVLS
jgi:SAM-dependent methyltransferase